jgi:hypothetical protein
MLIDTSLTIAFKCSTCGSFEFFNLSIFKLLYNKEYIFTCRCNNSRTLLSVENFKEYKIKIGCIGCGNDHIYLISRKEILNKDINIFHCPETGIQQCFIGKDYVVRRKIDNIEKELDELIDMFGYDSYFKNTRVMFDSLNRVHDIAEQGNLYCECGNDDIELRLLSDKIHLKCNKCQGSISILASTNEDLKKIQTIQSILLSEFHNYRDPISKSATKEQIGNNSTKKNTCKHIKNV